jgi:hypothetical protein
MHTQTYSTSLSQREELMNTEKKKNTQAGTKKEKQSPHFKYSKYLLVTNAFPLNGSVSPAGNWQQSAL